MPASTDAHTHGHGLVSKVRGYLAGGTAHRWEGVRRTEKVIIGATCQEMAARHGMAAGRKRRG